MTPQDILRDIPKRIDTTPYKIYATKAPNGYRCDYADDYQVSIDNKGYLYTYDNKLFEIGISDKRLIDFPRKVYWYTYPQGKLYRITYLVDLYNGFEYDAKGQRIALLVNDKKFYNTGYILDRKTKTTYFNHHQ